MKAIVSLYTSMINDPPKKFIEEKTEGKDSFKGLYAAADKKSMCFRQRLAAKSVLLHQTTVNQGC